MLARFYIEDSDFSGVDGLQDRNPAEREQFLQGISALTNTLAAAIRLAALLLLIALH